VPRDPSLALFDALGSDAKTLHADPGNHAVVPEFEADGSLHVVERHPA
jgi:hypothetical protein